MLVCSIRSLHEERLAQRAARARRGAHRLRRVPPRGRRGQPARAAPARRLRARIHGHAARLHRDDRRAATARAWSEVFERIVYSRALPELIEDGFLAPLRGYRIATTADLRQLSPARASTSTRRQLAEAVDIEERNALVARSIQELARDRRTIAFCVTVNHARNLAHALNALGVPAGIVHGAMPARARAQALADFRAGRIQVLTNVGVLTEGFDDPGVSCVAMARPTRSEGLYAQCVGRGTRLHPGKTDCLILDFVDLTELSLCTLPSLFGTPRDLDLRGGDADRGPPRVAGRSRSTAPASSSRPGAVTLAEIQDRAASFDPLTLRHERRRARDLQPTPGSRSAATASGCTFSAAGRVSEVLVVRRAGRGKCWEVVIDGRPMERFSRLEEAVEAVDFELERMGEGRCCRPPRRPRGAGPRRRSSERRPVRAPRTSARRCA